jgi:hypothetical protein
LEIHTDESGVVHFSGDADADAVTEMASAFSRISGPLVADLAGLTSIEEPVLRAIARRVAKAPVTLFNVPSFVMIALHDAKLLGLPGLIIEPPDC